MKKKFLGLTLICILLFFISGCAPKTPKYLPGENEGDSQFVWVCEKPFAFFYLPDDNEGCYGFLKGYIEKNSEFICFYSEWLKCDGITYFKEENSLWEDKKNGMGYIFDNESFTGYGDYYKNKFYLDIMDDRMNFFDGEFPELRFDKMTKEDFLERYGDIEEVSENLLELETYALDK